VGRRSARAADCHAILPFQIVRRLIFGFPRALGPRYSRVGHYTGHEPSGMSFEKLNALDMPALWTDQRKELGFSLED